MTTNVSKQKRDKLVEKIKAIKTYIATAPQDENTQQLLQFVSDIERDIKGKKYGLVYEEHREQIDEILDSNLPVLEEDESLFVDNGGQMNFLIEGDNLASLKLLEKTHRGKIDLIYIDPPYNTGNKDFIYDDCFVDSTDSFRHSKWLSFMEKRLQSAYELLSLEGVIFISIDDNEQATLKTLCDDIFGVDNFLNCAIWYYQNSTMKNPSEKLAKTHEYVLIYRKSSHYLPYKVRFGEISENLLKRFGKYADENYQIYLKDVLDEESYLSRILPKFKKEHGREAELDDVIDELKPNYLRDVIELPTIRSNDFQKQYNISFNNPKNVELIKLLLQLHSRHDIVVLDFFAGSGTTGHAVMKLNAEDGGNRKFILCTNNENNICRDVTYERIKRVIDKENYKASLKYYKVDYLPISDKLYYEYANDLLKHVRELVELENGINFNGNSEIAICLTEEELDKFVLSLDGNSTCRAIYLGHDVLTSDEQEKTFVVHGITVNVIPDYYYKDLEG